MSDNTNNNEIQFDDELLDDFDFDDGELDSDNTDSFDSDFDNSFDNDDSDDDLFGDSSNELLSDFDNSFEEPDNSFDDFDNSFEEPDDNSEFDNSFEESDDNSEFDNSFEESDDNSFDDFDDSFEEPDSTSEIDNSFEDSDTDPLADITFDNTDENVDVADLADGIDAGDLLDDDETSESYSDTTDDIDMHNSYMSTNGDIVITTDPGDSNMDCFTFKYIDVQNIVFTKRIREQKSMQGLVQSIKSTGLLEPLVVAPLATEGQYVLLAGYRRMIACLQAGKRIIPCVINNKIRTEMLNIIEALYNHNQKYTMDEQINYIETLKTNSGIMNPSMIEYILQMNNGDYSKLQDILADNDDDIVSKLKEGVYDIATAYKKLEQRRKKESAAEKEDKRAAQVYDNEADSGIDAIHGSGDDVEEGFVPSEEMLEALNRNSEEIDDYLDDKDLDSMIKEDNQIKGFEPHVQKVNDREYINPAIKKAVMARDKSTCQCCRSGGPSYVDTLDYHHTLPVFLGGNDSPENAVMLCLSCHKMVHLYSTGDLTIEKDLLKSSYDELTDQQKSEFIARVKGENNTEEQNKALFDAEKNKMKRIVYFGGIIRKGIAKRGLDREQYKKDHPNTRVGRRMPGKTEQETT